MINVRTQELQLLGSVVSYFFCFNTLINAVSACIKATISVSDIDI